MRRSLMVLAGVLAVLVGSGVYWVFALGAAQPDGPPLSATDRTFQIHSYTSQVLRQSRTYAIRLPADYGSNLERRYPTIYLLHGGHGHADDWFVKAGAAGVIDQLTSAQQLPEAIVVAPDGNDRRGSSPLFDPDYIDGPNGKVLSALGDELVQVVDSRYRTIPDRRFRALGGLSSGGWGAINIGLHYPQNFAVLFSHSGYFTFNGLNSRDNSPQGRIVTLSPKILHSLAFYLDAGDDDGEFLDSTRAFASRLGTLGATVTFHAFPGGHGIVGPDVGWNYWHKHLTDSLRFVGEQFARAQEDTL